MSKLLERTSSNQFIFKILWFVGPLILLNHCVRIEGSTFLDAVSVPVFSFKGVDFKIALSWATALSKSMEDYLALLNNYPPFVSVIFLPLSRLSPNAAYNIYTFVLLSCFLGIVWLSQLEYLKCGITHKENKIKERFAFSFLLFTTLVPTYPVLFALERGNSDLLSGFLVAIALFLMTQRRFKWCTLALAAAIQIKIYPMILGALLFLRAGWRAILNLMILTIAGLLIIGPAAAKKFFSVIYLSQTSPYVWKGNHSLYSWFAMQFPNSPEHRRILILGTLVIMGIFFTCAFFRNWICVLRQKLQDVQVARPFSGMELGLVGMAFQFMSFIPGESHDYKLGIQLIPYLMVLSRDEKAFGLTQRGFRIVYIGLSISMAMLFMTPSTRLLSKAPYFVMKTPWLLILFALYVFIAFWSPKLSIASFMREDSLEGTEKPQT